MGTTTLRKQGDGQRLIVPKADCERAGVATGDGAETRVDVSSGAVVSRSATGDRRYRRERKVSAAELLGGWGGGYELPSDLKSSEGAACGREAGWGTSVGKETR